jgi:hypothetical protein
MLLERDDLLYQFQQTPLLQNKKNNTRDSNVVPHRRIIPEVVKK